MPNNTPSLTWGAWSLHVLRFAFFGGLFYFAGLLLAQLFGLVYSSMTDWTFRLSLVVFLIWGVWTYRLRLRGYVTFLRCWATGMSIALGMAVFMSLDTLVFQTWLEPEYHQKSKELYAYATYNRTVVHILTEQKKEKLDEEAQKEVQNRVDKHMSRVDYFFTPQGSIIALWIYAAFWGLGISLTVAFLARPVEKKT